MVACAQSYSTFAPLLETSKLMCCAAANGRSVVLFFQLCTHR